jgi:hypothetical protein
LQLLNLSGYVLSAEDAAPLGLDSILGLGLQRCRAYGAGGIDNAPPRSRSIVRRPWKICAIKKAASVSKGRFAFAEFDFLICRR